MQNNTGNKGRYSCR